MRKGRNRRRAGGASSDIGKALLIAGIPLSLMVAGFIWLRGVESDAEYGDDLCLLNQPVVAHTVLVIDRTDVIDRVALQALERLIERVKADMKQNERFSVFSIEADRSYLPRPLFSLCNPGTKRQANVIVQTPEKIQRRFEKEFAEPLQKMMSELSPKKEAEISPILETITAISQMDDFNDSLVERRLILFSDMLQNSRYTHYNRSYDFPKFLDGFPSFAAISLNNVRVEISYITRKRARALQGNEHMAFWRRFFNHTGARIRIDVVG